MSTTRLYSILLSLLSPYHTYTNPSKLKQLQMLKHKSTLNSVSLWSGKNTAIANIVIHQLGTDSQHVLKLPTDVLWSHPSWQPETGKPEEHSSLWMFYIPLSCYCYRHVCFTVHHRMHLKHNRTNSSPYTQFVLPNLQRSVFENDL